MSPFEEHLELARDIIAYDLIPGQCSDVAIAMRLAFFNGNKVIACGNGGSAAQADHFVAELLGRFKKDRLAYPAIALASGGPTMSAIANDYDFSYVFSRQVAALAAQGDMFFAISTSGESENVCYAADTARANKASVIALTGKSGGRLKQFADVHIAVPSDVTARIQEMHALILHAICEEWEQ